VPEDSTPNRADEPEQANDTAHREAEQANDTAHREAEQANDTAHREAEQANDTAHREAEQANDTAHREAEQANDTALGEAEQAIEEARRRLAEVPAEVVVTNHVMGLYELAAIHLSTSPPNLASASLAIDAVGCLVDGLGDRLGTDAPTLRDALANIRMAFVSVKSATTQASPQAEENAAATEPAGASGTEQPSD
jgi:vacuolar-type H+-ATPase subunit H